MTDRVAAVRRPSFTSQPVDASFFELAPFRVADAIEIQRSAADVWADLTGDDALSWCRILHDLTWTSPRPFGVGTTRTVRSLGGTNVLDERYFRWEEGRRKSFYVEQSSAPLFKRFAEDYLVEPTSETSCRFTWTIAAEPKAAARITSPGNKLLLGTLLRDTRKHYGAG
jgi:hypothetical protein